MAAALESSRDYLVCVVELFDDRSPEAGERIRAARRHVGLAAVNAEESFQEWSRNMTVCRASSRR